MSLSEERLKVNLFLASVSKKSIDIIFFVPQHIFREVRYELRAQGR